MLRLWYKSILIVAMFLYGMIAVATIMPLLGVLLGRRAGAICDRIRLNWNRTVCRILNVRLQIHGELGEQTRLLVANHISWLDIIALGAHRSVIFVAKQEVAAWPVLGYLAKRTGTLFVRRGDARQTAAIAEQMAWKLRQGKRIVLFPEGTTTTGERVLRFHSRLFQPAQLAQVQVQAVAIEYRGEARAIAPFVGEDEFLPHLLRLLKHEPIDIHLHYCLPLSASLHRDVLAQTTRQQIVSAIAAQSSEGISAGM